MQDLLTLAEACKLLPKRNGKKLHLCTLWRWCRKGVRGVLLRTVPVGGHLYTTAAFVQAFLDALADERKRRNAPIPWPRRNDACHSEARRILAKKGPVY